ncbi:DUF937 domain-containing protein [Sphingobacterium shayense]|uniref:DUF937 domain-containing protein n=1 Tax=Sphingobacterium shayense TaxID=626343 RepID=UPI001553801F|nr:DUF937 domain-containing protein [Sphingobacterium shayense]NQD70572.1 DUF937 domain-containing protein [Sphingobacterium shayense]
MNISDLITGGIGSKATSAIANTIGVSESKAKWIMAAAVPLMIAALNYNAKNKGQEEAIDKAVNQHSSGGLLDKLGGLLGGDSNEEGNKIVQHMFGNNTTVVTDTVAQKSGLSKEQVGGVLATLAPIVMSYLGQQKNQNSTGGGGIGDLMGSILGGSSSSDSAGGLGGLLSGVFGGGTPQGAQSSTESSTDVLGDLAGEFFNKDKDPQSKGNILESIAGMFSK